MKPSIYALLLTHSANVAAGANKGFMNSQGKDADNYLEYLIPANALSTAVYKTCGSSHNRGIRRIGKCAITGAVASPLEFLIGWILGYVGEKAFL